MAKHMHTRYHVVSDATIAGLDRQVTTAFILGWQPLGGVTVTVAPETGWKTFFQAMTRSEPES